MSDESPPPSRRPAVGTVTPRRRTLQRVLTFVAWAITCACLLGITFWVYNKFILHHAHPEIAFTRDNPDGTVSVYKFLDPLK